MSAASSHVCPACVETCPIPVLTGSLSACVPTRFSARERLWSAGEPSDRVVLLCRGVATLHGEARNGDEHVLAMLTPASALGLADVLDGQRRASSAEVLADAAGCVIRADVVRSLFHAGGPLAGQLLGLVVRSLKMVEQHVLEVGYGTVEERIARVLARLGEECGVEDARGTLVPVKLSRTQLAGILGCRVETLVRALHTDELATLVTFARDGVVLHDLERIRQLGHV